MRRRKIFGMVAIPLNRNDKAKLLFLARARMRATEKGKAYGQITAKAYAVFCALLMGFHNAKTGRCFPSYTALQEAAGCCRATVAAYPLEAAGLLSVCNRLPEGALEGRGGAHHEGAGPAHVELLFVPVDWGASSGRTF